MGSQLFYRIQLLWRTLWIRATIISALGFVAAALAPLIAPLMPSDILVKITGQTVRSLLDILANSMLTVTTFSLTIMVTTHLTAAQQVTPRVHRLLRSDTRTQTVLATFIGAFVFSLTSIVLLQLGLVGEAGFATLYVATLVVIALVILSILRWVGHLSSLGSLEDSVRKVQHEAETALESRYARPFLGGEPTREIEGDYHSVFAEERGFVQHIDTGKMSGHLEDWAARFHLEVVPGDLVRIGETLGTLEIDAMDEDMEAHLRDCFTLGDARTYEQDAIFGITVLTEIAERALSPGVNDPQTAIDVLDRLTELLESLPNETPVGAPHAPGVHVPKLEIGRAVEASFTPIARDGAAFAEVQMEVQTNLARLAKCANDDVAKAAEIASGHAMAYAEKGLLLEADIDRLREMAVAPRASKAS